MSSNRNPRWTVTKFNDPDGVVAKYKAEGHCAAETAVKFKDRLISVNTIGPNAVTTIGATIQWNILAGISTTLFSNGSARLGVSTDTTVFDIGITNLNPSGTASYYMQIIDATYPQVSGNQITWESTFPNGVAEFDWYTFGVDNDAVDGAGITITSYDGSTIGLYNYLNNDQGTKAAGQTWILTLNITQS